MTTAQEGDRTLDEIRRAATDLPESNPMAEGLARDHQDQLTKPRGSLGRLEDIAIWMCAWQGRHPPVMDNLRVIVFAGNHGVAEQGVSAFPSAVTVQMVANFKNGGAAINQLSRAFGAAMSVVEIDLDAPTRDFTKDAAMDEAELLEAFNAGWDSVPLDCDLLALGEMGIANTTSAAALACALFGGTGADWAGPGTGLDEAGVSRKVAVIDAAMALHGEALADPLEALRRVGGRELAALTGAVLGARHKRVPVLLDGFVVCSAAAVLHRLSPKGLDHCMVAHVSAEPGHRRLLGHLGKEPLLDLGMRLGEASGAAVAFGLARAAVETHCGMATFAEAGVANKEG